MIRLMSAWSVLSAVVLLVTGGTAGGAVLTLAEDGRSDYVIVIARDAPEGIRYAARELAFFVREMTGAELSTVDDSSPAGDFEFVIGETNRKRLGDVPENLQPHRLEGLVILPEGKKLFIMGNSSRGTLYGVYDLLEQELGVRFLTVGPVAIDHGQVTLGAVNHVPSRPTLRVDITARRYDPPLEYRNICWPPDDSTWSVRARLNATWGHVPMRKMLGGVKWVGPSFVHTFDSLVPTAKYFDEHPEYFSLIDGKRRREYDGLVTQLCMTNPAVLRIATLEVRDWIKAGRVHADDKLIASVTVNDSGNHCKCVPCKTVNAEEGVDEGGTLIRFVNAIAREVRDENPNVLIETLGYAGTRPTRTPPEDNVMIRWVGGGWQGRTIEDSPSQLSQLLQWEKLIGAGGLYSWFNLPNTQEMLYPVPNLLNIDHNIRFLVDHKVTGIFALASWGPGTDVFALRSYLLGRCMWRPSTDGTAAIQEFCELYYGKEAAPLIMEYLDEFHAGQTRLLRTEGYLKKRRATFSGEVPYNANALLARAEEAATTPVRKLRVAELRMQPWYFMVNEAYGTTGTLVRFPDRDWHFRYDGRQDESIRGDREGWAKLSAFDDGWRRIDINRHWTFQGEERRGTAWYAIDFEMPAVDAAAKPALSFGAVDGDFEAYIDGEKVGERYGVPLYHVWQHHFYLELPKPIDPGRHVLTLRVKKDFSASGVWKPVAIVDLAAPIAPDLHEAAARLREVSEDVGAYRISEAYGGDRMTAMEKVLWPNLETFLKHRPEPGSGNAGSDGP